MFINPKTAIEKGWIVFPDWADQQFREKCLQPNALDITCDKLFRIGGDGDRYASLSEASKTYYTLTECQLNDEGFYVLEPGGVYDMMSDFYINVPQVAAATLTIRSTLSRCGLALNSGIWDSSFHGNLGAAIHNRMNKPFWLAPHTRVCQLAFVASEASGEYAGGYNSAAGVHWSLAAK